MQIRFLLVLPMLACGTPAAQPAAKSHPPLRTPPAVSNRPLAGTPPRYVDAKRGDDRNDGSVTRPWKTIRHALRRLPAGTMLVLRGGVYREHVSVSLRGTAKTPITIRSAPGEIVIIDGGFAEFFDSPATAWLPVKDGAAGEFRSAKPYRNLRNVLGWFGDSMVGLNTYYHARDLRATNELIDVPAGADRRTTDIKPLYCGPGLWYDAVTGFIHVRLAHTHLPQPVPNYRGETDPRKLPLVISAFRSRPLTLDGAEHVRIQDVTIRGGGYDAVVLENSRDVELDNVTIWCGTYGVRATGTERLKLYRCGLYGSCPQWLFRGDSSKRAYPGRPLRDITRLNTHANLIADGGREFSVYAHPVNDDWEISHCEFTDAHDGPYLGGVSMKFHHNLVENTQDDGVYLSQMYPRHRYAGKGARIEIFQNVFRGCLTAFAFGGPEDTRDEIFIYRNVVDLRTPVWTGRPRKDRPTAVSTFGKLMGDHGSPPWPAMSIYHNTFVMRGPSRDAAMASLGATNAARPRRVFNNVFLHLERLPAYGRPDAKLNVTADGNLYWSPGTPEKTVAAFFQRYRKSPLFAASKTRYPAGIGSHSLVADPKFVRATADGEKPNDYRLQPGSPAINAGVPIPAAWPDPLRKTDAGRPDIGALPIAATVLRVGR